MAVVLTSAAPNPTEVETFTVLSGTFPLIEGPDFRVILIDALLAETDLGLFTTFDGLTIFVNLVGSGVPDGTYSVRVEEDGNPGNSSTIAGFTLTPAGDVVTGVTPDHVGPDGGTITVDGTFTIGRDYYARLDPGAILLSNGDPVQSGDGLTLVFTVPAGGTPDAYTLTVWWIDEGPVDVELTDTPAFTITALGTPTGVKTAVAPTSNPGGRVSDALGSWLPSEHAAPDGARRAWNTIGRGGVLSSAGAVTITAASPHGYEAIEDAADPRSRLEIQVGFKGSTSSPLWASGVSGHVLSIDDGERTLGVSIGDTLTVVDPGTGDVLWTVPDASQPGGWTRRRVYHLVKVGTTWWELSVDGRLVFRLPYRVAVPSGYGVVAWAWGWLDTTIGSTGEGEWSDVERGHDVILPPRWKVDRQRLAMPAPLQDEWSARHEALLRATVGVFHAEADRQARAALQMGAGLIRIAEGRLVGDQLPTEVGWTDDGPAPTVVRRRLRYEPDSATQQVSVYQFPELTGDAERVCYGVAATFTIRSVTNETTYRAGPSVVIVDGDARVGAQVFVSGANSNAVRVGITDGALLGPQILRGQQVYPVPVGRAFRLELVTIERTRALLFVDGVLVEDVPFDMTGASGTPYAWIGCSRADAMVDVEDGITWQGYADGGDRPGLQRRVAERLVFAGGCEVPARLDVWLRHRFGAFAARGTDRVLSEIRRLACDDDADTHAKRLPAAWYLDVTYPDITPVFLVDADQIVTVAKTEVDLSAPNFSWTEYAELVERYLLPMSTMEARFELVPATTLTTDVVTTTESVCTVANVTPFSVGAAVTFRREDAGAVLTLEYDDAPAAAADTMTVEVDEHGHMHAEWTAAAAGRENQIGGTLALLGLDADKAADITAGAVVKVRGTTANASGWAEVIGVKSGAPVTQRLPLDGTSEALGTVAFDSVHGVVVTPAADGDIEVLDADTDTVLYTVADGDRASGVHLFDPPASAGFVAASFVADGATTADLVAGWVEDGGGNANEVVTLTGAVPVAGSVVPQQLRWIAAGYVEAARTVTVSAAKIHDREVTTLSVVSTSAADVQTVAVVVLLDDGTAELLEAELNGTTPVLLPVEGLYRVMGMAVYSVAVGTIRLTVGRSTTVASIAPAASVAGIKVYRVEIDGPIEVSIDAATTTPRWVVLINRNDDLTVSVEAVRLDTAAETLSRFTELRGLALGDVPTGRTITVGGRAWFGRTWEEVVKAISGSYAWTYTAPPATIFDAVMDRVDATSVIAGPVDFDGVWSVVETTTVTAIAGNEITTEALTETFVTGDRVRLGTDE